MDNKKTIGYRITEALAKTGKLQKDIAKEIGVKDNVVSYFCSGARTPNTQQIIAIADFLNVSVDYLLGRSEVSSRDEDVHKAQLYTGLSEEALHVLHGMNAHPDSGGDPEVLYAVDRLLSDLDDCYDRSCWALADISIYLNRPYISLSFNAAVELSDKWKRDPETIEKKLNDALDSELLQEIVQSIKRHKKKYYSENVREGE